jgi:hypothetical protein
VSLNEWGAPPAYEVTGARWVVLSSLFGASLPGAATFRPGVEVPLLEDLDEVALYVAPHHLAPVRFVLDTGATTSFATWDVLSQLGIPAYVPAGANLASPTPQAAGGEMAARFFVLDRLGVGPHVLRDQPFIVLPTHGRQRRVAGLGSNVFADVVLDLDLAARVLRIDPTDPFPPGAPFALDIPLPSVHARFGDLELVALIDTGAAHTSISPALCDRLHLAKGPGTTITDAAGVGLDLPLVQLPAFELAGAAFAPQQVGVLSIAPYEQAVGELYMNVGVSSLNGHRLVIDYPNRTVAILADPEGESIE